MKDQVLSIEQMQELINMGIDVSNASMCWNYNDEHSYWASVINYTHSPYIKGEIVPTFTLQDILGILPSIKGYLPWDLHRCAGTNPCYMCVYEPCDLKHTSSKDWIKFISKTPLEAAFNMLKWCKLNNKL